MVTTARKSGVGTLGLGALLSVGLMGLGACGAEESGGRSVGAGPEQEGSATSPRQADSPTAMTTATPPGANATGSARAEPTGRARAEPAGNASAAAPSTSAAGTEPFEGTVGRTEQPGTVQHIARLVSVRTGRHAQFDRVVFDFAGTGTPGYHIEYMDRTAQECGSGRDIPVAGAVHLGIRFMPAQAHDAQGQPTINDRARAPGLPVLKELRQTCDFEGQVEWVFGLAAANEYRVLELSEPTRLVVDLRH